MCGEQLQTIPIPRVCEGVGREDLKGVLKQFQILEFDIALLSDVDEVTIRVDGDSLSYATQRLVVTSLTSTAVLRAVEALSPSTVLPVVAGLGL